uniref:Uncharacterized protein n=1 Tax=Peronospora matthiolae TaxID=2874970 RepID=A0AAV1UGT1_9STRA
MAPPTDEMTTSAPADHGHERVAVVGDTQAHERGAVTDERILTMLAALKDRMQALKASQMQIDEDERLRGAIDSAFFASALGRGMGVRSTVCRSATAIGRCSTTAPRYAPVSPPYFEDVNAPVTQMQQVPTQELPLRVLDARQRKLAIRKFDGGELCQGLGSGFADWGRTFLR